jgi:hypothetical protein
MHWTKNVRNVITYSICLNIFFCKLIRERDIRYNSFLHIFQDGGKSALRIVPPTNSEFCGFALSYTHPPSLPSNGENKTVFMVTSNVYFDCTNLYGCNRLSRSIILLPLLGRSGLESWPNTLILTRLWLFVSFLQACITHNGILN